eukprot:3617329-Pleurochrysis_carterae.AAC.1
MELLGAKKLWLAHETAAAELEVSHLQRPVAPYALANACILLHGSKHELTHGQLRALCGCIMDAVPHTPVIAVACALGTDFALRAFCHLRCAFRHLAGSPRRLQEEEGAPRATNWK